MNVAPRSAFQEPVDPPPPGSPWTVLHLLRWSARYLEEKGVPEPRLDAEHLLAHALDIARLDLYLQFDRPLTPSELATFKPLLLERATRKPLQYVTGRAAFRDLDLHVDPRVLIPRPETEELVDAVLRRVREWGRSDLVAVDVGTGSGAIALSLALEGPFARVVGIDRSPEALVVARANAEASGLGEDRVEFREANLIDGSLPPVDVLVSNPPYVSPEEHASLDPEVRDWEPREALVSDDAGLGVLRRLIGQAPGAIVPGGLLALEVGASQARAVEASIRATPGLGAPVVLRDLSGRDRIVLAGRVADDGVSASEGAEEAGTAAGPPRGDDENRTAAGPPRGDGENGEG